MIIKVENEYQANICDDFLTKLILDERNYDKTLKGNFVVKDYFKNVIKNRKDDFLYLYQEENNYVGYIYLKKQENDYLIDGLFVEEDYRNKGIAKELIEYGLNEVKKLGCNYVSIRVMSKNDKAINLYKKIGFEELSLCLRKEI